MIDYLVIGAGVVGMACAAELARHGDVLVLEQAAGPALGVSSRNSEVIHAGLYYPEGSLKAVSCVEGREELYRWCAARGVPHRKVGKLVVATDDAEIPTLERIAARARANGAGIGDIVDGREVGRREPRIRARAALWSPETGIVDAHALVGSYQAELERLGGTLLCRTRVIGLAFGGSGWRVDTVSSNGETSRLEGVRAVVAAAGLSADRVTALAGLDVAALGLRQHPCKGDYFTVAPSRGPLSQHLIYPVPDGTGLGIHITLDLGGRYRLGPDTEYVAVPRYDVDPAKAQKFAEAARRYLPALEVSDLTPDFAGIRPTLSADGEGFRDFALIDGAMHGVPGFVSLVGIESPGLTSAPALARRAAALVRGDRA
jgi:L-2-hydroxyglutarate oxidase LhgO